jgi:DNA topoisomerase-1
VAQAARRQVGRPRAVGRAALIVDREREIELFRPQEYWSVIADMEQDGVPFTARLVRWKGKKIDRLSIGKEGDRRGGQGMSRRPLHRPDVETKPLTRNPPPPFTTSTLQQEAARKLGFSASHTMRVAQDLYEDGAITYMRTDGVQMDGSAPFPPRAMRSRRSL